MRSDLTRNNQQYPSVQMDDYQSVVVNSEVTERLKKLLLKKVVVNQALKAMSLKLAMQKFISNKLEGRIDDLLTDNENLIDQLNKQEEAYQSIQSSGFGKHHHRVATFDNQNHYSAGARHHNMMSDQKTYPGERSDNTQGYRASKSDKIEQQSLSPDRKMHGLSTGLALKDQKSTEFMQVMSSVLNDPNHPQTNQPKDFDLDQFTASMRS